MWGESPGVCLRLQGCVCRTEQEPLPSGRYSHRTNVLQGHLFRGFLVISLVDSSASSTPALPIPLAAAPQRAEGFDS